MKKKLLILSLVIFVILAIAQTKKSLKTQILYSNGAPGVGGCTANQDGTIDIDYATPGLYICDSTVWTPLLTFIAGDYMTITYPGGVPRFDVTPTNNASTLTTGTLGNTVQDNITRLGTIAVNVPFNSVIYASDNSLYLYSTLIAANSSTKVGWTASGNAFDAKDTNFGRAGVATLKVYDVTTGTGTLIFKPPTTCSGMEAGTLWNNAGTVGICP